MTHHPCLQIPSWIGVAHREGILSEAQVLRPLQTDKRRDTQSPLIPIYRVLYEIALDTLISLDLVPPSLTFCSPEMGKYLEKC